MVIATNAILSLSREFRGRLDSDQNPLGRITSPPQDRLEEIKQAQPLRVPVTGPNTNVSCAVVVAPAQTHTVARVG